MDFNLKPENINELLNLLLKDLKSYTNTTNIEIKIDFDENLPGVKIDKERISQVLINLINNAIKFTKKGTITIKTELEEEKKQIKVSVIDTGTGIQPQDIAKIFVPFYQIKEKKEHKTGGTGLGLSIVSRIAERHGGSLSLSNGEGGGAKAVISIPR